VDKSFSSEIAENDIDASRNSEGPECEDAAREQPERDIEPEDDRAEAGSRPWKYIPL
jgi:hypothetical protein